MRHLLPATVLTALFLPAVVSAQTEAEKQAYSAGNSGGYLSSTASTEERNAYNRGVSDRESSEAAARSHREAVAASSAAIAQTRQEIEALRTELKEQPPLPSSRNPLLGRWVMVTKAPEGLEVVLNAEAMVCAMFFGEEEFEYRHDTLVLADAGGDIVADKVSYRAGKDGAVFALGERLVRLMVFEFDAGPDRMRNGKCVYRRVVSTAPVPATPAGASASSDALASPAAPASPTGPRAYPGAGFKVGGFTLGSDTPGSVSKVIAARGGTQTYGGAESIGPLRFYARDIDWSDVGTGIYGLAFDFDEASPAGRLIAVTLIRAADAAALPGILQQRAANLARQYNLSASSATRLEGTMGGVRVTLDIDPVASAVMESYRLDSGR